jgi:predicted RecA/RadA family phage recombinase
VVVLGDLVGIAKQAIKAGTLGALALVGVFDLPKATGVTINVGNALYWDAGNQRVWLTSGSGLLPRVGNAVAGAGSAATTVRVRLNTGIADYTPLTPP